MGKLKDLADHDSEMLKWYAMAHDNNPRPNGIACPECGAELLDSNPQIILTSAPPQLDIHCDKCDYIGYRIC